MQAAAQSTNAGAQASKRQHRQARGSTCKQAREQGQASSKTVDECKENQFEAPERVLLGWRRRMLADRNRFLVVGFTVSCK
jgi:hypothetical protein